MVPRETGNNTYAKFEGTNKEYYYLRRDFSKRRNPEEAPL